ncbi:hypothetical protein LOC67_12445 [Stieleria sp. JC731]|uniref:hypothetical protein n=1 Tax=Pirellulaceae TaxID=2691357 RepID=UPI001E3EE0B2|nr:hypothetical protein [Stieleria sp. JC731]MCC9601357.1 hypothetical protein [Stieleria sp. JC731]
MSWSPLYPDKPKAKSYIGDEAYDCVADCFDEVRKLYQRDWKRKPTLAELIGTVEAVLDAQIQDLTNDGESAELVSLSFKTRKIPKRQAYAVGDILLAEMKGGDPVYARIFENGDFGPMVGVYDSRGMSRHNFNGIIARPLIVKICPIHREVLVRREWLVIGNMKLKASDKRLPRGPLAITGNNNHLEMAEHYYGLRKSNYYARDEWIVENA